MEQAFSPSDESLPDGLEPERSPLASARATHDALRELLRRAKSAQENKDELNEKIRSYVEQEAREIFDVLRNQGFILKSIQSPGQLGGRVPYVRRDDPFRVTEALTEKAPIHIHAEEKGGNIADGTKDGLAIAFERGHSGIGLQAVYGFSPDHIRVTDPEKSEDEVRDLDHTFNGDGNIESEDITFALFRTPHNMFPEEELTDDEQDAREEGKVSHIYRLATKEKTPPTGETL